MASKSYLSGLFLSEETTESDFRQVRFPPTMPTFWLPLQATDTAVYEGVAYRNQHRYLEHRLLTVETAYEVLKPAPPGYPLIQAVWER